MKVGTAQESFRTYYRRDGEALARLATRLTGSTADGEDLAQDVLERLARSWQRVGLMDNVDGYARRILINESRDRYRRRQAERDALGRLASQPTASTHERDLEDDGLWVSVRALPDRQREVVALVVLEERSLVEVAAILGISAPNARQAYSRARRRLKLEVARGA